LAEHAMSDGSDEHGSRKTAISFSTGR
jgi:hypothetical protein